MARGGRLSRRRVRHVTAVWIALFALLALRMAQVQVWSSRDYEDLGRRQRIRIERQLGPRGDLFDRDGVALAMSVPVYTVSINPRQIDPSVRSDYEQSRPHLCWIEKYNLRIRASPPPRLLARHLLSLANY